jgi:iron complex transport system ATP-binding protein
MLEVSGLSAAYGSRKVLRDISFEVRDGEILGVIGPNGAGKTTLLKCIDGLICPEKGRIRINGRDTDGLDIAKLIGYVPQVTESAPSVLVFDAILIGRKPHMGWRPGADDRECAWSVIRELGVEDLAMRRLHELSGGERQKIFMARALAQEPQILLLDEPTSNLDIKYQVETMELLREHARSGLSVVVAMHDLNMALRYCDRFLMLKEGRVFCYGGREILSADRIREVYGVGVMVKEDQDGAWIIPDVRQGAADTRTGH